MYLKTRLLNGVAGRMWWLVCELRYMIVPVLCNSEITGVPSIVAYLSQSGGCAGWI